MQIGAALASVGVGEDQALFDPSVVRGLEYYTGAVFEAQLTFPIQNEDGEEVVFGSVAGGGVLGRGMSSFTAWVWIGRVRISRVRSTSMTSMSGVVLMSTSTSPSAWDVDIAMERYLF